jgi:hypothetical protein
MILSNGACSGHPWQPLPIHELHVAMLLLCQPPSSLLGELRDQFDAEDALRELRQDRRLVAQPGTDFQHAVARTDVEQVGHDGDDERLRDRLAESDGQGRVGVGVRPKFDRNELVARHFAHDIEYPLAQCVPYLGGRMQRSPGPRSAQA